MLREQTAQGESAIKSLPEPVQKSLGEFIVHIKGMRWFQPDGRPNPEWQMTYANTLSRAREVATKAALRSARNILWRIDKKPGAAWNSEYWDTHNALLHVAVNNKRSEASRAAAEMARRATIDAVRDRLRLKIWHEMKDGLFVNGMTRGKPAAIDAMINLTANAITLDVAAATALKARAIVLEDLDFVFKETHNSHISRRMDVLEKGYYMVADIDGVFYVCCTAGQTPEQLQLRL